MYDHVKINIINI